METNRTASHLVHLSPQLASLTDVQRALLERAYGERADWKPRIEREFGAGLSGARTLLVTFASHPPEVVKLAEAESIQREVAAYQRFATRLRINHRPTLPMPEPLVDEAGMLALLIYGEVGTLHTPPTSILDFYRQRQPHEMGKRGEAIAKALRQLLDECEGEWWNRPPSLPSDEFFPAVFYDRLLPPHLEVEEVAASTAPVEVLQNGQLQIHAQVEPLTAGSPLRLQGFRPRRLSVKKAAAGREQAHLSYELLLEGLPANPLQEAPLRIRVRTQQKPTVELGGLLPELTVVVTRTRRDWLVERANNALQSLPNDAALSGLLDKLPALLYHRLPIREAFAIHGDLNLNNILLAGDGREPLKIQHVWLIDFEKSGAGPALFDFQRLECEMITHLLSWELQQNQLSAGVVVDLLRQLHSYHPSTRAPHPALTDFYTLQTGLRLLAGRYLRNHDLWREYYVGLAIALIGTLKFENLDRQPIARALALLAATTVIELMSKPLNPAEYEPPGKETVRHSTVNATTSIAGDANTTGDFVGRDKNTYIIVYKDKDTATVETISPLLADEMACQPFEPETLLVPAHTFWMGSDDGAPSERPRHSVRLPAFRISKRLVSNRQYAEFIAQSGRLATPELGWAGQRPTKAQREMPVTGVTFFDALAYCEWLQSQTGRSYSLPHEAAWEAATALEAFVWGDAREWTTSLWGESMLQPDEESCYPWLDDGWRNDIHAARNLRRVVRGENRERATLRRSESPDQPGSPGKRLGFRLFLPIQGPLP